MTAATSVIHRALRMLGVIDPDEAATATMATGGLTALNQMVHGWKSQGVNVGHEDWALDTDVTLEIDPKHVTAMTALLAVDLLPEYPGSQLPPPIAVMATNGWVGLQAAYFDSSDDSDLVADMGLRTSQASRRGGWYSGT